jgi:ferrochelatase
MRAAPEVRTIAHFHDDPGYIEALAHGIRDHWMKRGRPEVLVMSFHGIPRRAVDRGDPYERECHETATLLAEALGLGPGQYRVAFQSRFGRAQWLQPYTAEVLAELGRQRLDPVDVICPGFVSDCLETLEEIRIEGKALFVEAGGGDLRYIPCLNDRHEWLAALTDMAERSLDAWSFPGGPETLEESCRRAGGPAHA